MDVQMPEMDGLEATGCIRECERSTGRHIPILAMTAHAMKGDRERCLEAGMDGYLSKPIQVRELLGALAQILPEPAPPEEQACEGNLDQPTTSTADVFDAAAALERMEGDADLFGDLVRMFLEECPTHREAVRQAIEAGNASALAAAAHTVKGCMSVLCARAASEAAFALESMGCQGDLTDVEAAWNTFARETRALEDALSAQANPV
jgi:HPt (histidine-containing phosphotransfer) domain-containing protein